VDPRHVLVGRHDRDPHAHGARAASSQAEGLGPQGKRAAEVRRASPAIGAEDKHRPGPQVDAREVIARARGDHRSAGIGPRAGFCVRFCVRSLASIGHSDPVCVCVRSLASLGHADPVYVCVRSLASLGHADERAWRAARRSGAGGPCATGPARARGIGRYTRGAPLRHNRLPVPAARDRPRNGGPRKARARRGVEPIVGGAGAKDTPVDTEPRRGAAVCIADRGRHTRSEDEHVSGNARASARCVSHRVAWAHRGASNPVARRARTTARDQSHRGRGEAGQKGPCSAACHRAKRCAC
jgi:hypothetical protein